MDSFKRLNSAVGLPKKPVQTLSRTTEATWIWHGQLFIWVGWICHVSTCEVWMTTMVFSCSMSVRQRFDCNTFRPFLHGYTAIAINPSHLYERGWANVAHGHDPVCRYLLAAFHAAFPRSRCWRIIKKKSKSKVHGLVPRCVRVCVCVVYACQCERLKYDHLCFVSKCSISRLMSMALQVLSTATCSFLRCVVSSYNS